ncbi:hypothetical protein OG730_05850 [Streptomyces sp. NBC_01298]|uniref:hypothetical protein n=1 Tax=Streptomyces sp. NBC_01298 TaxID=2903817 RepID=UPI002E0E9013|nr:hypothetical protein OG730_05850 [Streptomyces sp. NBC_01298]
MFLPFGRISFSYFHTPHTYRSPATLTVSTMYSVPSRKDCARASVFPRSKMSVEPSTARAAVRTSAASWHR